MFLSSGKNEYGVRRWFLKSLEEGIERCLREHVYLIDDIDAVSSYLWRYAHLVDELAYVVNGVVRRGVQLVYIIGALLVEGAARLALVAGLALGGEMLAVD